MVLIDRKMPKSCGDCWYDKICKRWMTYSWGMPPPNDCPLKELPPHGRLIDADEFLKMWCNAVCRPKPNCYEDCAIYGEINNAPTIIPAEPPKEEEEGE